MHLTIGIDTLERMWLLDLWRKQTSSDKWIPPLLDMFVRWNPIIHAEESGQIEKSVGPFLLIVDTLSLIGRMIAGLEAGSTPAAIGQEMGPGQITLDKLVELERARKQW